MSISRCAASLLLSGILCTPSGVTLAQTSAPGSGLAYPDRPIRIVTAEAGGGNDFAARQIAQGLAAALGQPVIVENRSFIYAVETAAKAVPNGYTLFYYGSTFWMAPLLGKVSYDPQKDFAPIVLTANSSNVLAVHPSVQARSVKELIALAKARPGQLNYASGPTGNANHLAAELFNYMAGVNIVRVAYKGTPQAVNDVIAGHVQITFNNAAGSVPHVKSGRLRGLAVTGVERSALLPDLPTVAASGLPGYESGTISGMWAPAGTPAPVIDRLYREVVRILMRADVKERFFNTGIEAAGRPPSELAAAMKTDMARMEKLIRALGIRVD